MRLRTRFVLVLGIFILVLTGLVAVLGQRFFLWRSRDMELRLSRETVERCARFIAWRSLSMSRIAGDWAAWDDTYQFIQDRDPAYVENNLVDSAFTELRLNLVAMFDVEGHPAFVKAYDLQTKSVMEPPPAFWQYVLESPLLRHHADPTDVVRGLVVVSGEIWMVASRPILTSNEEGPIRGALMLARRWGPDDMEALALCGSDQFSLHAASEHPGRNSFQVETPDWFTIVARGPVVDIDNQPTACVEVRSDRWFFTSGLVSMLYLNGWILLCGGLVGIFVFWLVDRWVLRALERSQSALRSGMMAVATDGDPRRRLQEGAKDEMGELVRGVNEMLTALERAQQEAAQRQHELIRSQKMAALGTLVAGVAHEVNNPNSVIALNSVMLLRTMDRVLPGARPGDTDAAAGGRQPVHDPVAEEARSLVEEIHAASLRIATLVKALKGFARPSLDAMTDEVAINDVIRDSGAMLRHRLAEKRGVLNMKLTEGLPALRGNSQQLMQVLVNLIQNACDAIDKPEGHVEVTSMLDRAAGAIVVVVSDNGRGIRAEDLDRIFEPFFTTRRDEGGTGLGLPISAAIVDAHGGRISVESVVEQGARFTLTLPLPKGA